MNESEIEQIKIFTLILPYTVNQYYHAAQLAKFLISF